MYTIAKILHLLGGEAPQRGALLIPGPQVVTPPLPSDLTAPPLDTVSITHVNQSSCKVQNHQPVFLQSTVPHASVNTPAKYSITHVKQTLMRQSGIKPGSDYLTLTVTVE